MTTTWDEAIRLADKHGNQGGLFVRLQNDGDKVVGAFCGEPYARQVVWTGERYEDYDEHNPEHEGEGRRKSLRVAINFYVPAESSMKVIEGGNGWFRDVVKVREKYGLDTWLFEIERHGEAKNPKTTYSILPEEKIDGAMRARIQAAPLHDLRRVAGSEGGDEPEGGARAPRPANGPSKAPPTTQAATPASRPIDPEVAAGLVARLKVLARPDLDAFLRAFRVQRVRDLTEAQAGAAAAWVAARENASAGAEDGDVDPFG
ncbi:MAG TPA: hypothetical protein VFS43_16085 [Polyangiaceae bacterium]|nr:hypothetical protein [Polyangiaceae bacterium]